MRLRPYQSDLVAQVGTALETDRSVLLQLPTGGGKTHIAAHVAGGSAAAGERVWIVAHRREIVGQTSGSMAGLGVPHGVLGAGRPFEPGRPVQVCAIGSLIRRAAALPPPDLIVWDEAHHVAAASWAALRARYPEARHLGLTATPERLDGKGLGEHFASLICGPSTADLMAAGHLSRYRLFAPTIPDLRGVGTRAGDYDRGQLAARMTGAALVGDAVEHYRRHAPEARAIAFCVTVEASRALAARFNAAGLPAAHVGGDTPGPERDAAVAALAAGRIRVLTNVEVFTEGFDLPAIDAVILLRPTRSLALHRQMVGRGLRAAPGKGATIILDHAGLFYDHGLPDEPVAWSLDRSGRRRAAPGAERLRRCPDCSAVQAMAAGCPECGHTYTAADRTVREMFGELREVEGRKELPSGYEALGAFAARIRKNPTFVRRLFKRGLPRSEDGFIPIQEGLDWIAAGNIKPAYKLYPRDFPAGACETQAAFAERFGVSAPVIGKLTKLGLPAASNGWIIVEPALAWIAANPMWTKVRKGDTHQAFAKRVNTTARVIQRATKIGLPLEPDGSISIKAALAWWKRNGRTDEFEGIVAFCKRIGIGFKSNSPGRLRKRGLPVASNGLVHIATGLKWVETHGALAFPGKSKMAKPLFEGAAAPKKSG